MKMNSAVLSTCCVFVVAFVHSSVLCAKPIEGGDTAKHGVCPRRGTGVIGPCVERCSHDRDCPDAAKCCSNGCGHVCTKPYTEKPGVCPNRNGAIGSCAITCWDDSPCPGDEKCCFNGCGHGCMKPYKEKPGVCPKRTVGQCVERCSDDSNCPGNEKCCSNGCGHVCMKP